jgi:ATP-dependent RNA helicase DOB1
VETLLPLLQRGIGIHHGGLLPILKEVIEILFQEGLIKCLFATETFSIGINMPARTVIFTNCRKFDGKDFRWVTSGEYIQMSGRAGRRGKDDRGIVIQMVDEKMEPDIAKNMLYGPSDGLYSSYHITYNMVVNMLRVEDANPEALLRHSFYQYQQEQQAPALEQKADDLTTEAALLQVEDEAEVASYHALRFKLDATLVDLWGKVFRPEHCSAFLQVGRLVKATGEGWGPILNIRKEKAALKKALQSSGVLPADSTALKGDSLGYSIDVLVLKQGDGGPHTELVTIGLSGLSGISAVRLNLPNDVNKESSRKSICKALTEVFRRFKDDPPPLDPVKDMGIKDADLNTLVGTRGELVQKMETNKVHSVGDRDERLEMYGTRLSLMEQARAARQEARATAAVTMRDELRRMKRVLRKLSYITAEGVLTTKGQFACQLNTADELMVTDMIFEGVFNDISVEHSVALLSCFVHQEPVKDDAPPLRGDFQASFERVKNVAKKVAEAKIEMKVECDEEEYVNSFNPGLMDVAFAWAAGRSFVEVCNMTDFFEGNIIRSLRRLEELLRQSGTAAGAIGNVELKDKFELGATKLRRGIVFAASLYV